MKRDLNLIAAGLAISTAGDAAALVALLLRLQPHGSGWVAGLLAAELIPYVVLAPLTGRVVDRFETRSVLLVALAGQAVLCVPLALVSALWATVLLFAGITALSAFVRPATSALVPAITGADAAQKGYARLATGTGLGWIAGPAAGGLLTGAFGATAAILADAVTFTLLTAACAAVRTRRHPAPHDPEGATARGGLRLILADRVLRTALLGSAIAVSAGVVDNVAAPFRFVGQLGAGDSGYGLYLTLWGIGALLAAQVVSRVPLSDAALIALGNLLIGAGIAGIGLAPTLVLAFVASLVGGFGNGVTNVAQNALISTRTPPDRHGRAFAAAGALIQTAIGVGTAAASPLVTALKADGAMLTAGLITGAVALVALILSRSAA
ncbi:MFS transporter [Dactylosporangium vinaceum]|uniref:MFS transporter n=1 Tax=Dactylosporangium vinaceum TaxID=53362 RepID=A0ABV5MGM8_9ACTN|nr:MFS transporter [Dactylosporangium vinaceum]UAB95040.1 MFS transporter [Dactylosporangium vinaceum]